MNSAPLSFPYFYSDESKALDVYIHELGDAVCVTNDQFEYLAVNKRFAAFYGLDDPAIMVGKSAFDLYPDFKKSVFYEACEETIRTGNPAYRVGYSMRVGTWLVMRCAKIGEQRYMMITHKLQGSASMTGCVSLVDSLTSLSTRAAFDRDIGALMANQRVMALAIFDINHFKAFNENMGFEMGDRCLMEIGSRLKMAAGLQARSAYRLGHDQFLLLAPAVTGEEMKAYCKELLGVLEQPMESETGNYAVKLTVGVAEISEGMQPIELLQRAETALNFAKKRQVSMETYQPGSGVALFNPTRYKELKDAIKNQEFVFFLQPQKDLIDDKVVGAEALLRWRHPKHGILPPDQFLPLAEEARMMLELDHIVIKKAFEQLKSWEKLGIPLHLSINLSSAGIACREIPDYFAECMKNTPIHPERLCIEITENGIIQDIEASKYVVQALKGLGFHIAIDDFGTGYCSMAYLTRYPSNFLKIDRSFIRDLVTSTTQQLVVKNMINLAHSLGIVATAEGVEDEKTQVLLKRLNCDIGQGYHYSKPIPDYQFVDWLEHRAMGNMQSNL